MYGTSIILSSSWSSFRACWFTRARVLLYSFHARAAFLACTSLLLRLPLHHDSGSSYLFTTYVDFWLATVLLELGWGFNGTFTDYPWKPNYFLNRLAPLCAGLVGAQEWPSVTICHRLPGREIQQALDGWERYWPIQRFLDCYVVIRVKLGF